MPAYDRDGPLPIGSLGDTPLAVVTNPHRFFEIPVDDTAIPEGMRALDEAAVEQIADSIKVVGFQAQGVICVQWSMRGEQRRATLVAGRHRLEALRRLGWPKVPVAIFDGDAAAARLWQLAENLARSDLTALERAEQLTEFVELQKAVQNGQVLGGRGNTGGIRAIARELRTSRQDIYRAEKIAGLAPQAKAAAIDLGLADSASALRRAAGEPGSEAQIYMLQSIAERKSRQRKPSPPRSREADEDAATVLCEADRCAAEVAKRLFEAFGDQKAREVVDLIHRAGPVPGIMIGEALERRIAEHSGL